MASIGEAGGGPGYHRPPEREEGQTAGEGRQQWSQGREAGPAGCGFLAQGPRLGEQRVQEPWGALLDPAGEKGRRGIRRWGVKE